MEYTGLYSRGGNTKLGYLGVVNRPAIATCPGASAECKQWCYANKGNFTRFRIQERYCLGNIKLPSKLPELVRVHASGDFDSVDYIKWWIDISLRNPDTKFWAYTRSWNVSHLLPALERLRDMPNVQLFASVDPSMPKPPNGWRIAHVEIDTRFRGMECLAQNGKAANCKSCGYCFAKAKGNVKFRMH